MVMTGIDLGEARSGGHGVSSGFVRGELEALRGILEASRDACWCIEYDGPVDLTVPEQETQRQLFENVSYWRLCNDAMAKLYKLPAGLDFNEQSVHFCFHALATTRISCAS